jgi:hypothetical protein
MNVSVKKEELLKILESNKNNHHESYEIAVEKWRSGVRKELDKFSKKLDDKKSGVFQIFISLPVPEEHIDDYDRTIRMVKLDTRDILVLEEEDARHYLEDEWNWSRSFLSNTMSYMAR